MIHCGALEQNIQIREFYTISPVKSKETKTHSNSPRKSSLTLVSLRFRASVVMFYQKTNLLTVTNHYSLPTSGVKVVGSFSSTFLSLNKQVYCSVLSWQFKQPVKVQVKQFAKRKSRFFFIGGLAQSVILSNSKAMLNSWSCKSKHGQCVVSRRKQFKSYVLCL